MGISRSWAYPSAVLAIMAGSAGADVWNEATQGDLSNNREAPTPVPLGLGTHSLRATTGKGDLDYLSITLAPGTQLSQILLVSYASIDGMAFAAIQNGPIITEPPEAPNVANLLGWTHFGPFAGNVGTDILDDLGSGPGAIGFTPPLPAATYSFWLQQLGFRVTYQMDFVVVPGPACYANCDGSTGSPVLNVNDFICFQSRFAASDPYADCDQSTTLNVNDFICFQSAFAAGCR